MPHVISDKDWPDFKRLIAWWRSRSVTGGAPHQQNDAVETAVVVLTERLESGRTASAVRMKPGFNWTQDIYLPDITPPSFQLAVGGDQIEWISERFGVNSTLEEIETALRSSPLKFSRLELGYGQRWKVVFNGPNEPAVRLLNDPDQPRLLIRDSQLIEAGEFITVHAGAAAPLPLPAGTLCQASHISAQGWIVSEFEQVPQATSDAPILYTGYPTGCVRQTVPTGDNSECSVCLPGNTPAGFLISVPEIALFWPAFYRLVAEENESEQLLLVHDSGCRFVSDFYADDSLYFELTLYGGETEKPSARLRIIGANNSIYGNGLDIVYWSDWPFDALAKNKVHRVSHASQGNDELPLHESPACLLIEPYIEPCFAPASGSTLFEYGTGWSCVSYWETEFQGERLFAGKRGSLPNGSLPECQLGCEWPPHESNGEESLQVRFVRTVCGEGDELGYLIRATIQFSGQEFRYEKEVRGSSQTDPGCLEQSLLFHGTDKPADIPQQITIKQWQM